MSRPYLPTTEGRTTADFDRAEAKARAIERGAPAVDVETHVRLAKGDIVGTWRAVADGQIEQTTRGVIALPLAKLFERMPAERWSRHLAGLKGGDVAPYGSDRQVDTIVLRTIGADLMFEKLETVRRDPQGTTVYWELVGSENGTVPQDVGYVRFERFADATLVTFRSVMVLHKLGGLSRYLPSVMGPMVVGTFKAHIAEYRKLAA